MNLTWLFVLIVYAACTLALRVPKRVALLFYALVLLVLFRPLTQDVVLTPADIVRLVPPWSEARAPHRAPITKYDVSNLNLHDVPMQIVPWVAQVREAWRRGEVPLWNARAGSGMPLLANGQSTPFSIFRLLTLPLSLAHALAAEAAWKLLLALTLTFLFCRTRYSPLASLIAAIAYGFSTWMLTWLQFPIAAAAAFLPGVFWAVERLSVVGSRLSGEPSSSRTPDHPQPTTDYRFAILLFTLTVLSGHPETIYNIALFAAAYGLWLAPRRVWRVALASVVAALLCLPFLVPFGEAVLQSQRFAEVSAPRASLVPPYSDFPSAILLLQPRFFGELPIERPWGPTSLESICGFAGVLAIAAAIATLFDLKRRWRERETLYLLLFVLCIGIVLGWPLLTEAFAKIAGHAPAMRMRLGICWFGALLAASAIDRAKRDGPLPLLAGTLAVSVAMLSLLQTTVFPSHAHRVTAILAFLPSVAVLFALTLIRVRGAIVLIGALTFVELFLAMRTWNTIAEPRALYPRTPLIAAIPRDGARVVGLGGQLYPNTNAMFGLDDVRVHDPMAWNPYVRFLTKTVGWNAADYYAKWNDAGTPLLDYLNVRYVLAERELPAPRYRPLYAGPDGRVYENTTVLPRFFAVRNVLLGGDAAMHTDWRYTALVSRLPKRWSAALTTPHDDDAHVEIVQSFDDLYRLRVHATRPALIVSSIPDFPGWRVKGGEKICVNEAFVGVIVDAGERDVEVAYRPRSFQISVLIAALTLLLLVFRAMQRRRLR
ncbi:MAG TPA: hypothetical protein VHW00_19095 [Thermoanaerobaculia bacterium]|nr:hypothetical protein [Thermoanaerobaculia bacterium]